jgi:transposase
LAETQGQLSETQGQLSETQGQLSETQRLLKLALERITQLEERLNKNSSNSSKPPSTDRKPNSSGGSGTRKPRNKGTNRAFVPADQVDHFHTCSLNSCPCCGSKELIDLNEALLLQQVELPEVKAIVTQYIRTKYRCKGCDKSFRALLPEGVPNSAFGPRLMALIAMLTGVVHLSKRDAIQLVKDLYGIEICEGSVINVEERVARSLNEAYERIHQHVMESSLCKHFDETSWRDQGQGHYVWVASTSDATCFCIDRRRSKEVFQKFTGTLAQVPVVTDRYGAYTHVDRPHQYCLAHLIRDFRKFSERDGPDGEVGQALETELRTICKNHRLFRGKEITKRSRDARFRHQKRRIENYLLDGLANGSDELSGLCNRLLDCFSKLWTFSEFTDVDPTNNLAERDLRKVVLWRKKSYGTRSKRGQRFVERISSVTQTLKKVGTGIFAYLIDVIQAFYCGKPAPLVNPTSGY